MSGKNLRFRAAAAGLVSLLFLAVAAQAAVFQPAPPAMGFFERMIPASLRLWRPAQENRHRRPLPLKCGGTIDPNGSPCPPRTICAGCG